MLDQKFITAAQNKLRRNVDNYCIARKRLLVDPLPQGTSALYNVDADFLPTIAVKNNEIVNIEPEITLDKKRTRIPLNKYRYEASLTDIENYDIKKVETRY